MTSALAVRPVAVTPALLLALHAAWPERYPALLESAATAEPLGRFDILFACPGLKLTLRSGQGLAADASLDTTGSFLDALDRWWLRERIARDELPPTDFPVPFTGGWLVYLGYELAGQIEPRLRLPHSDRGLIAQAVRVPAAIVYDRVNGDGWIVAERAAASALDVIAADLERVDPLQAAGSSLLRADIIEDAPELYLHAIERALEHIVAGDIYQANLSRSWHARLNPGIKPVHLYQRLRRTNPGPFCGIAVFDDMAIVSSSPERLVAVRDGWIATRPIAGTRPRGTDTLSDAELARELRAHPKEQAEHVMLVDLERNDLGRVCEPGSVLVDEFMTIESYAHVHHIVSNIRGKLRTDVTPGQALAAVFPGGTITGCPKVRCMEIIASLESTPRGAYTGSLGYLNRDGSMDFNILIRSLEVHGDRVSLRAGAGIVADSIPQRELEESRAKARGVLRALSDEVAP
ncbi:MAG TPA: aminodeoxychorismate synthase component I [Steroidobacteraceae bacterium]|jgi:anthranilate synthase component 1